MPYANLVVNPNQNKESFKIKSKGHPRKVVLDAISLGLTYEWIKTRDLQRIVNTGVVDFPKKKKHKRRVSVVEKGFGLNGRKKDLFGF